MKRVPWRDRALGLLRRGDLSQATIAERFGVPTQYVSQIATANGLANPKRRIAAWKGKETERAKEKTSASIVQFDHPDRIVKIVPRCSFGARDDTRAFIGVSLARVPCLERPLT